MVVDSEEKAKSKKEIVGIEVGSDYPDIHLLDPDVENKPTQDMSSDGGDINAIHYDYSAEYKIIPDTPKDFYRKLQEYYSNSFVDIILRRVYAAVAQSSIRLIERRGLKSTQFHWSVEISAVNQSLTREVMTTTILSQMLKCLERKSWSNNTLNTISSFLAILEGRQTFQKISTRRVTLVSTVYFMPFF